MKKKILICIKTYPNLSNNNSEVVCTAGIDENGDFIRIYPIPYRKLDDIQKYKKYQYIEVEVTKTDISKDKRKESYHCNSDTIKICEKIDTKNNWSKRKDIIFNKQKIYDDLNKIKDENKKGNMSLCIFKPTEIIDVIVENNDNYENEILKQKNLKIKQQQMDIFEKNKKKL